MAISISAMVTPFNPLLEIRDFGLLALAPPAKLLLSILFLRFYAVVFVFDSTQSTYTFNPLLEILYAIWENGGVDMFAFNPLLEILEIRPSMKRTATW